MEINKDIITLIIAVYGAALSTIIFYKSLISVKIDLLKNMTSSQTWFTNNYIKITNTNKEPIYIQSIWISLLWEPKTQLYFLNSITTENSMIWWLQNNLYQTETNFSLYKLKTIQVCTWHWKIYKKHFVNIFRRILNK